MGRSIDIRKRHGIHYTPPLLARFLARRVLDSVGNDRNDIHVLDPACGDGELLVAIVEAASHDNRYRISITGFDLDEEAIARAHERLSRFDCNITLQCTDFTAVVDAGERSQFEVVITNPPYVRTQALGSETARTLANRFGLEGRVDLTHVFVKLAPTLLAPGGTFGLLCSNRFLTTKAGANIRSVLDQSFSVEEIYDLGDTKIFDAAVLPAIVIARTDPGDRKSATRFVRVYEAASDTRKVLSDNLFDSLLSEKDQLVKVGNKRFAVTVGNLESEATSVHPWRLVTTENRAWHERVRRNTWRTFADLANIRVGIKTTADSVFIRDNWDDLNVESRPENELLLPLLTHENVEAWSPPTCPTTRVLYPYDLRNEKRTLLDMDDYPKAFRYLEQNSERLKSRKYVTESGRKWYEIWVPQKPAKWVRPKLVFPDISVEPRFSIDRSGAVINGDCYWISLDDLISEDVAYLMLGVANSSFGVTFYDEVCGNKLYASRRRWITQYVGRLPLPSPDSSAAQEIVALARKLCECAASQREALQTRLNGAVNKAFLGDSAKSKTEQDFADNFTLF